MPKMEKRLLKVAYSIQETQEMAIKLANKTQELGKVEDDKAAAQKQFAADITAIKAELGNYSNKVSSGYEMKMVDCRVDYHRPAKGKKTYTRMDTMEQETQTMTPEDWNLFTQEDDFNKRNDNEGKTRLIGQGEPGSKENENDTESGEPAEIVE